MEKQFYLTQDALPSFVIPGLNPVLYKRKHPLETRISGRQRSLHNTYFIYSCRGLDLKSNCKPLCSHRA